MDLYAEHILDHYRRPRGQETIRGTSVTHRELNASCGDDLSISLLIENDHIVAMRWEGSGCAISQAAMSMLAETLPGMGVQEAATLPISVIYELLVVPIGIRREKCALLCLHALKNALRVWQKESLQDWSKTLS